MLPKKCLLRPFYIMWREKRVKIKSFKIILALSLIRSLTFTHRQNIKRHKIIMFSRTRSLWQKFALSKNYKAKSLSFLLEPSHAGSTLYTLLIYNSKSFDMIFTKNVISHILWNLLKFGFWTFGIKFMDVGGSLNIQHLNIWPLSYGAYGGTKVQTCK